MPNIFTPPVIATRTYFQPQPNNKRKKLRSRDGRDVPTQEEDLGALEDKNFHPTTLEEEQHYRAKWPLQKEPPPFPFPHKEYQPNKRRVKQNPIVEEEKDLSDNQQSLHMQHLTALTTILHLSLLRQDFSRASRALGLLFREEVVSENAAVRNQGFIGIAAEVLLRGGSSKQPSPPVLPFTYEGFQKAKRFYERLIIKHPYHKSWPNMVNAIDFYLAMFNLWIYVVQAEHVADSDHPDDVDKETEANKKVRVLEQANEIASRLDMCMATVPFMDEPELIRLGAMVSLWVSDLHKECANLGHDGGFQTHDSAPELDLDMEGHLGEARIARDKAKELFSRLERPVGVADDDGSE